ncbi:MAG: hypothetical protein PHF14_07145 [Verrucomicrobiota bacterium]|jgi:DNA-binding transcriptional regulator/RsmH inhibitor MraZ|nr:hypothetical protein [Verrucomicrobiota bacterium]MDD8051209.1 hypothetical protein [Verrucomicrobiota bacterium]MDI9385881.1 hypothetical protein [Verrucomicrobiota bacterium]
MNDPRGMSGGFMGAAMPAQPGGYPGAAGVPPGGGWGSGGGGSAGARGVYVGRYEVVVDDKLRITVPAHWRSNVTGYDGQRGGFYLMPNEAAEMRLVAYPQEEMDIWAQRLMGLPHGHPEWEEIGRWSTSAEFCPIDRNGRLTVPQRLVDAIAIFPRETIVLFGVIRRFEICSLAMAPRDWDLSARDDD